MQKLELIVRKFLQERGFLQKPLLLALSGGPDSMALFHLLLKIRLSFEVAHVDHRWRSTSEEEAESLRTLCHSYSIPFHLKTLSLEKDHPNLEELCRQKRLDFFRTLLLSQRCEALLTAHHADDQAETVLKRVLEGASLNKLSALLPEKKMKGGMILLRPLLSVSKSEILSWLQRNQISFFIDSTNQDLRFLRARMREKMMPQLSELFGKNVQKGLCHLAEHALAFEHFLEEKMTPLLAAAEMGKMGEITLFFPEEFLTSPFLLEEALKRFFNQFDISLTGSLLKLYSFYLQSRKKLKVENYRGYRIEFQRGRVTIMGNNRLFG